MFITTLYFGTVPRFNRFLTWLFILSLFFPIPLQGYSFNGKTQLSKEEKAWLKTFAAKIRYAQNPSWPPAEYIDENGIHQGIVADYLAIIEKKTDVTFQKASFPTWNDLLNGLRSGDADFTGAIQKTEEREKFLSFTDPFLSIPLAIIVKSDFPDELTKPMIDTMTLAVVKGYAYLPYLLVKYPNTEFIQFVDDLSAILQTSVGRTDGVVTDLVVGSYMIEKFGVSNLKLGKMLDYKWEVRFGATKKLPQLAPILNKVLGSITPQQRKDIYNKWVQVKPITPPSFIERNKVEFTFTLIIILIIATGLYFYNRLLKKNVREKTSALQEKIIELEQAQKNLLMAKEKAEESDRLKSAFLANLSHEIRTPLNGIIGFSDLLKQEDNVTSQQSKYCQIIIRSSHQLLHIVSDILEISRLSAEKVEVSSTIVSLNNFFQQYHIPWTKKAEEKGLSISLPVAKSDNLCIQTDEPKLKQVLQNLIDNALKFMKQGSVTVDYTITGNWIEFSVTDEGIGIDPEMHDLVFERFRQVETEISRQYGGLGLGLSIAKEYVELMGGTIHLTSTPGMGAEFTFTWPLVRVPCLDVVIPISHEAKSFDFSDYSILVAEDETINQDYIQIILKSTGISVIMASDGYEALEALKNHPSTDLILLDIKMPNLSGIDTAREILKTNPDIPLIALTAFAQPHEKREAMDAGFSCFLTKPIRKEKLLEVIGTYLKK